MRCSTLTAVLRDERQGQHECGRNVPGAVATGLLVVGGKPCVTHGRQEGMSAHSSAALLLPAATSDWSGSPHSLLPLPPAILAQSVARDIMVRLKDAAPDASGSGGSGPSLRVGPGQRKAAASSKGGCC